MSRMIHLTKMQAAGNDFILLDDMRRRIASPAQLARRLCHRQFGVGADGIILLQPARNGDSAYRMRIINSDGSEAEMCGNGSRCAVKFAVERGIAPRVHAFETLAGQIGGRYDGPRAARVSLTQPSGFLPRVDVRLGAKVIRGSFINTGVPHFVTFVSGIDALNVKALGRAIRTHRRFAPRGTNVNFVRILRSGKSGARIRVRTYERGVEDETLACGTGATASAVVAGLVKNIRPPIDVVTTGGSVLRIDFRRIAGGVSGVTMRGPVEQVFETRIKL